MHPTGGPRRRAQAREGQSEEDRALIELYLIRHGVAEERGGAWADDAKRPLSRVGVSRLTEGVRGLARLGVSLDAVATSPLLRARQTADIVAAGLEVSSALIVLESLAPGGSPRDVLRDLARFAKRKRVALVGHEPGLGELTARLIGASGPIAFKKGGVCRIDIDAAPPTQAGHLRWFAPPKMLRGVPRP